MTLESLLLTTLFALTAVGLIGVLNARGVWRTSVAALLALGCLGAALYQVTIYRATGLLRSSGVPVTGLGGGVLASGGPVDEGVDGGWNQSGGIGGSGAEDGSTTGTQADELIGLTAGVRALRDSLNGEDPTQARSLSDSAYQAFEGRAERYLSQARLLRERAARLAAETSSTRSAVSLPREEVAESLNSALQSLTTAAHDLRAFFRATGREEELRLSASYRKGLEAAEGPLRRAETGARALSRATDFEAGEP